MYKYKVIDRANEIGGTQQIYRFPNDFGASIINSRMAHFFEFYTKIAVIKFNSKNNEDYNLTYDTDITDDVIITQSEGEEMEYLIAIKALEAGKE